MNLKTTLPLLLSFTLITFFANAQSGELPPNAQPGKCYARCLVPDQYETHDVQVIDVPASQKIIVTPAEYEMVMDTQIIKPATIKTEYSEAVFKSATDTLILAEATTKWVKGKRDETCLSSDPASCDVMCLVQVPAKYRIISKQVLVTPASSRQIEIPAEYKIAPKKVLKKASENMVQEIPATYKTTTEKVLVKKAAFGEWREVLCANKLSAQKVKEIQQALTSKGYNTGKIDNILGPITKAAVLKYQIDNNLPQGNLNMETLKALGIN